MLGVPQTKRASEIVSALVVLFVAGCSPVYIWDTHVTATPTEKSVRVAELTREPIATLGPITPAGLQGFSPFLSRALTAAISEVSPSLRDIPSHETVNIINGQGLSAEYGELISGFVRSGILERDKLQRLGAALGSHYVLLPGLAHFDQILIDRFEFRAGCDSGHGAKPEPGMGLAFAKAAGLDPADCAIIGDSIHDLEMGRRAGFGLRVGVLLLHRLGESSALCRR